MLRMSVLRLTKVNRAEALLPRVLKQVDVQDRAYFALRDGKGNRSSKGMGSTWFNPKHFISTGIQISCFRKLLCSYLGWSSCYHGDSMAIVPSKVPKNSGSWCTVLSQNNTLWKIYFVSNRWELDYKFRVLKKHVIHKSFYPLSKRQHSWVIS